MSTRTTTARPATSPAPVTVNAQTPGPLTPEGAFDLTLCGNHTETAVDIVGPDGRTSVAYCPTGDTDARLLAASYTAFDAAGRSLGVDAASLAGALDLAALIRANQAGEEILEAIADELFADFKHTARAESLRVIARQLRAALAPLSALPCQPGAGH